MLAKLRRDVLKQGIAVGLRYGFGGWHQPVEFVRGQSQSQLVKWGHGKRSTSKEQECGNRSLVSGSEIEVLTAKWDLIGMAAKNLVTTFCL